MKYPAKSVVMISLPSRRLNPIIHPAFKTGFSTQVCDKIMRPYIAQRFDLTLEESLEVDITRIG